MRRVVDSATRQSYPILNNGMEQGVGMRAICRIGLERLRSVMALSCLGAGTLMLALALLLSPGAATAGDPEAGAQKAYTCLGCHGVKHYVNTYPTYHVPRIAGQHEAYLVSALKAYRGKTRGHGSMQANAALLTDTDIEDIAAYFAAQAGKDPKKIPEKAGIEEAQTCAACHGTNGNSTQATNPKLAGQYKSYLQQALLSYRSGERENAIMSGFASQLSDADIKKLAKYFSRQKGTISTAKRP